MKSWHYYIRTTRNLLNGYNPTGLNSVTLRKYLLHIYYISNSNLNHPHSLKPMSSKFQTIESSGNTDFQRPCGRGVPGWRLSTAPYWRQRDMSHEMSSVSKQQREDMLWHLNKVEKIEGKVINQTRYSGHEIQTKAEIERERQRPFSPLIPRRRSAPLIQSRRRL